MTFDQIIKDIKSKNYKPVYFLTGDEPYYIDQISDLIEDTVLDEGEKAFNQLIVYGKDTEFKSKDWTNTIDHFIEDCIAVEMITREHLYYPKC